MAGGVVKKGLETAGRVVVPGGVVVERCVTAGRVVVAGGVEIQRSITAGRVVEAGRQAKERILAHSSIGSGITSARRRNNRLHALRKRETSQRDGDENKSKARRQPAD